MLVDRHAWGKVGWLKGVGWKMRVLLGLLGLLA